MTLPNSIRAARAEQFQKREFPGGQARVRSFPGVLSHRLEQKDGRQVFHVNGFATIFERGYDMWDMFGEYKEIIDYKALDKSLMAGPDVAFLTNHRGVTMARTTNGSLVLGKQTTDDGYTGLNADGYLNPDRQDVHTLMSAISDKLVTEMSFAFILKDGEWSDDFTEFRITEADINRGDVSAVNYGANPFTTITARTADVLADLERIPAVALSRAVQIATGRMERAYASAGNKLSAEYSARFARSAEDLARVARTVGYDGKFDLSGIEDWEVVDETGDDDEAPEEPKPAERAGKSLSLWKMRLEN